MEIYIWISFGCNFHQQFPGFIFVYDLVSRQMVNGRRGCLPPTQTDLARQCSGRVLDVHTNCTLWTFPLVSSGLSIRGPLNSVRLFLYVLPTKLFTKKKGWGKKKDISFALAFSFSLSSELDKQYVEQKAFWPPKRMTNQNKGGKLNCRHQLEMERESTRRTV